MGIRLALPPLYVILDAALLPSDPIELTKKLLDAGARLFQYRNKTAPALELLHASQALCLTIRQQGGSFVVNDRADICRLSGAHGVHIGQDDPSVAAVRDVVGSGGVIGVSTHSLPQVEAAVETSADYIAVGPIFATASKKYPDPVVGVDFIRQVRKFTRKPVPGNSSGRGTSRGELRRLAYGRHRALGSQPSSKRRARFCSSYRIVRWHDDRGRFDDRLRRFYRGRRHHASYGFCGRASADVDSHRAVDDFCGACLWRTGGFVPSCRRTVRLSARSVLAAVGYS